MSPGSFCLDQGRPSVVRIVVSEGDLISALAPGSPSRTSRYRWGPSLVESVEGRQTLFEAARLFHLWQSFCSSWYCDMMTRDKRRARPVRKMQRVIEKGTQHIRGASGVPTVLFQSCRRGTKRQRLEHVIGLTGQTSGVEMQRVHDHGPSAAANFADCRGRATEDAGEM